MFGQVRHNFIGNILPAQTFVLPFLYVFIKIRDDAVIAGNHIIKLFFAIIAYAYLHQPGQLRYFLNRVVHDGSMGIFKPFISFAQIHMRVNLQDAKRRIFFRDGFEISHGCAVVTAKQGHEFTGSQEVAGLLEHPLIQENTALVDFFQRLAHELILVHVFAL